MRSSTRCAPSPVFKKCSTGLASCEKSLDLRGCCLFALFASCNCTSSEWANNRRSHRPKRRDRTSCSRACQQFGYGIRDRKSTRLNSSHLGISYAVFCLKKKKQQEVSALPAVLGAFDALMVGRGDLG